MLPPGQSGVALGGIRRGAGPRGSLRSPQRRVVSGWSSERSMAAEKAPEASSSQAGRDFGGAGPALPCQCLPSPLPTWAGLSLASSREDSNPPGGACWRLEGRVSVPSKVCLPVGSYLCPIPRCVSSFPGHRTLIQNRSSGSSQPAAHGWVTSLELGTCQGQWLSFGNGTL